MFGLKYGKFGDCFQFLQNWKRKLHMELKQKSTLLQERQNFCGNLFRIMVITTRYICYNKINYYSTSHLVFVVFTGNVANSPH